MVPGLRFVVFMQGCHLRCKYCHNRDTWEPHSGEVVSLEELIEKIKHYTNYFTASNGGVTLSGGEPLLQPDFVLNLIKELKKYSIHVAIDTSRYGRINRYHKRNYSL